MMSIPIIDLFAGPGGLGEGFSRLDVDGKRAFKIALSIEKDRWAHQTLELRAFYRQFPLGEPPPDYYRYIENKITRDELFEAHASEAEEAKREAQLIELNPQNRDQVSTLIKAVLPTIGDFVVFRPDLPQIVVPVAMLVPDARFVA